MMILGPSTPWYLRGYRLFLNDVHAAWDVLRTGERPASQPDRSQDLETLLTRLTQPHPDAGRVILVLANGTGRDAKDINDVARPDVVAFTLAGAGASLHVHRRDQSGYIEWDDPHVAHDVLQALTPTRHRRWLPVWNPYRVQFIPATRAEHRETVRHRWRIGLAVPGAIVALVALLVYVL